MDAAMKKGSNSELQGTLGNPRGILSAKEAQLSDSGSALNQVDVSTQADILPEVVSCYDSEDETMGRRNRVHGDLVQRNKRGTPLYSKEDIREQYCITSKQLDVLDKARGTGGLFGCLSAYQHDSSCRSRNSLLSVCVRRKVPSDENLHELCHRPAASYAPIPRWPRYLPPPEHHLPPPPCAYQQHPEELECAYFRRRPTSFCNATASALDPKRYTWLPEDEECTRLERPRPIRPELDEMHGGVGFDPQGLVDHRQCLAAVARVPPQHQPYMSYSSEYLGPPCPAHHPHHPHHQQLLPPPPPPPALHDHPQPHRTKHVSFARSYTLTSFDDAVVGAGKAVLARSQERLIDGKKLPGEMSGPLCGDRRVVPGAESPKVVIMEKLKRAPMKTQATQTEVCLGRKPLAPNYLSLSPRTIHRVRMVSQGAQTNGNDRHNSRRLMKSYSEAGGQFIGSSSQGASQYNQQKDSYDEHEPLHRTQSEEPPRSPFLVTTPPESITSGHVSSSTSAAPTSTTDTLQTTQLSETSSKSKPGRSRTYKEIFIDFEPQGIERRSKKRTLQKTLSEGEILIDRRRVQAMFKMDGELVEGNTTIMMSSSQEAIIDDINYQYYHHDDVFLEPLEKRSASLFSSTPADLAASSNLLLEDLQEDEFHENLIYGGLFRKRSVSLEDAVSSTASDGDLPVFQQQMSHDDEDEEELEIGTIQSSSLQQEVPKESHVEGEHKILAVKGKTAGEDHEDVVEDAVGSQERITRRHDEEMVERDVGTLTPIPLLMKISSPFASSDSLANDLKDHSDSIWNESQATVLPADFENGTGLSCSDLSSLVASSAAGAAVLSLTPSSRRKQLLLLQHQQRSSMDTEALEEEFDPTQVPQGPPSPRMRTDGSQHPRPTLSVTTPSQDEPVDQDEAVVPNKKPSHLAEKKEESRGRMRDIVLSPTHSNRGLRRRGSPVGPRSPESSTEQQSLESVDSLSRSADSGKAGTDISETSTTEDYVTANDNNSGTDTSSRKSGSYHLPKDRANGASGAARPQKFPSGGSTGSIGAGDGSSFESASSIYSLARGELNSDELAQASCSPPPIVEENSSDLPTTPQVESEDNHGSTTPRASIDIPVVQKHAGHRDASSPSGDSSSSSGSYSVEGSTDDLDKLSPSKSPSMSPVVVSREARPGAASDEDGDHSGHYSSGYYESPADEDEEYGSSGRASGGERREWTDEEKRRKKKGFKLDFSPIVDKEESVDSPAVQHQQQRDSNTWSRRSSGKSDRSGRSEHSAKDAQKAADGAQRDRSGAHSPGPAGAKTPPESESRKEKDRAGAARRGKSRSRSPVQHHRRPQPALPAVAQPTAKKVHREKADKEPITPGMVRSPAMHEGFRSEDWGSLQRTTPAHTPEEPPCPAAPANNVGTSDESSCSGGQNHAVSEGGVQQQQQSSPRRHRRMRDSPRRKQAAGSGGRSPTTSQQRQRRRSGSGEDKNVSSVATLARRRSSIPAKPPAPTAGEGEDTQSLTARGSRLSPHRYSRSPAGSPSRRRKSKGSPKLPAESSKGTMSPESSRLKALSAESLRSVSPGSDSVFYSESADHSSNTVTMADNQGLLCHHCGREVDKATLSGVEDVDQLASESVDADQHDIVQPPAGFADSPEGPRSAKPPGQTGGRLYKKLEKRFRSEERGCHGERRHHSRFRCEGARAKSEERGKEDRVKVRPLTRSTDASLEMLRATDSSPNMCQDHSLSDHATGDDDEDDLGVYSEAYKVSTWIYISDSEEIHVWQKPDSKTDEKEDRSADAQDGLTSRRGSAESTSSEREFRRKYQAITHRMVHRKSSVEMYKRLQSKSFADASYSPHKTLQHSLEEILKQMLMIWCKESIAVKLLSSQPNECDKTVVVQRESGEFGFRIHGSRPVVVSAIEPDTPAESSGLEVGDIIISVNNVNVLDASHSEVVKLAHAGSDTLELEVARTCNVLTPVVREPGASSPLYSGFLWKLRKQPGNDSGTSKWIERWFCLKRDNCLYYYKSDSESQPLGALMLANYNVNRLPDGGRPNSFQLWRDGAAGLCLAADSEESATRWVAVISHSIERNSQMDEWLDISKRNLKLAPSCIQQPDCFGYLMKLGVKWKTWRRRYCVLKDACLYIYQDGTSESSLGMVCLHGYRVQNSNTGGKRFAFEIISSDSHQRHFYFHTDTEMDRKRWLAALEYSIDRWIKVG